MNARNERHSHEWSRAFNLLANAQAALGFLFTLVFVFFAATARFRVLYKDDWSWMAPVLAHVRLGDYVFTPAAEHVIAIPRLLMWLGYYLNGTPAPLTWFVGLGCYGVAAAALVSLEYRHADLPPIVARALAGTTLALLFFTYELQVFLSPGGITIPLAVACAVAAMLATIKACRLPGRVRAGLWLLVVVLTTAGGILSSGQGLAVPFALTAIALAARHPRSIALSAMLLAVGCGAALVFARATGLQPPSGVSGIGPVVLFGLAFLAGPVSYGSVAAGTVLGAIVAAATLRETYLVVRGNQTPSDCQLLCVGVIIFVIGTAAMTSVARIHFGLSQAAQSRYALFATLNVAAVLALWTIRSCQSGVSERRIETVYAMAFALTAAALPVDLFVGNVWAAKTENARTATLALRVGARDWEWLGTLYPSAPVLFELSRLAPGSLLPPLPQLDASETRASSLTKCDGAFHLHQTQADSLRVSGHLTMDTVSAIVITDSAGAVRGLVERAPIVREADPSYGQVIDDVWRHIRNRSAGRDEWFGFAQTGSGPPYRALPLVNGRPACVGIVM